VGDRVYTSGYPLEPRGYSFNQGKAIAVVNKRLSDDRGGYTVIYDAQTQPGMSGGGVFDNNGRLVAIHGQGERYRENTQPLEVSGSGSGFSIGRNAIDRAPLLFPKVERSRFRSSVQARWAERFS
jgi:V8-like Glu-specific endopeptidase